MKKLSVLVLSLLVSGAGAQEGTFAYVDLPVLGNLFATTVPARVLSLSLDVTEDFGVCVDPILGYGVIKGGGFLAGVYSKVNPSTRVGIKGVHYWVEDHNPVTEAFVDLQKYFVLSRKLKVRVGVSAGYGTQTIGRGDLSFDDEENRVLIQDGFTARANVDFSWWFPYGRRARQMETRDAGPESPVEEKLEE